MRGYIKTIIFIFTFSVSLHAAPFFALSQDDDQQAQVVKKIKSLEEAIDREGQSIESLRGKIRGSASFQKELDARLAEKNKIIEDLRAQLKKARVASDKSDKVQELSRQLDVKEREVTEAKEDLTAASRQIAETEDSYKQSQEKQKELAAKIAGLESENKDKKISQLQEELAASGQREATLADQIRQMQSGAPAAASSKPGELENRLAAKDKDIAGISGELDLTKSELERVKQERDKKIEELQAELTASGQREAALTDQARQAQGGGPVASDSDLRRQLETKDKELTEARDKLKQTEDKQARLVKEAEDISAQVTELKSQPAAVKASEQLKQKDKDLADKDKKISQLQEELASSGQREALMDQAMQKAGSGPQEDLSSKLAASQKELQDANDKLKASQTRQDMLAKEIETVTNQVNQIKANHYPKEAAAALKEKDKRINELETKVAAQGALLRQGSGSSSKLREQSGAPVPQTTDDVKELQKQLAAKEEALKVMEARLKAYEEEKVTLVKGMNETNNRIQGLAEKIVREQPQDSAGNKADMEKLRLAIQEAIARLDDLKSPEGNYNY